MSKTSIAIESFSCLRDTLIIRGKRYSSANDNSVKPAVILSHGFMADQRSTAGYAKVCAENGCLAFTYDFCGGCVKGTSDGDTRDMSVLTELKDLTAVYEFVKKQPAVDVNRIALLGCSQGGFVSALFAARNPGLVHNLILFYPALCIPDDARSGKMMMAKFDPANIPAELKCGPMKLGHVYPEAVINMDVFEEIKGYHGPLTIIHGTKDQVVNIDYSRKAINAYRNDREDQNTVCQLIEIENAPHGFRGTKDQYAQAVLKEVLCGKEEILHVYVRLTGHSMNKTAEGKVLTLPFEGESSTPWFTGTIKPGAADRQLRKFGLKLIKAEADYELEGRDRNGNNCTVHVVNRNEGKAWKPTVTSDSEALAFLNGADCDAILQQRRSGPIVMIFAKTE